MKKLFTLLFAASLALTIQAQDITNTLGTNGSFIINDENDVEVMTIKSDGKVGIGTATPNSTLEVAGSVSKPITIKTSNYTATENDYTIICTPSTGGLTVSLPTAADCEGRIYVIRNTRVGETDPIIIIDPDGAELIDGLLATLTVGYNQILPLGVSHSVTIQCDGTGWWVISATMYN